MEVSEWSSLCFSRFAPRKDYPGTQQTASFKAASSFPSSYTVFKVTHICFPETPIFYRAQLIMIVAGIVKSISLRTSGNCRELQMNMEKQFRNLDRPTDQLAVCAITDNMGILCTVCIVARNIIVSILSSCWLFQPEKPSVVMHLSINCGPQILWKYSAF